MGEMWSRGRPDLRQEVAAMQGRQPFEPRSVHSKYPVDVDRLAWPDWWFEDMADPGDARLCRALWAQVLKSTLVACLLNRWGMPMPAGHGGTVDWRWIGTRDFQIICDMVSLNGEVVAANLAPALEPGGREVALDLLRRLGHVGKSGRFGGAGA